MKSVLLAAAAVVGLAGAALAAAPVENTNPGVNSNSGATAPGNSAAVPHANSRDNAQNATGGADESDSARLTNCGMNGKAPTGANTATGNQAAMNCEPAKSGSSTPSAPSASSPVPQQGSAPASNR